jgi:ABC-2 type transport system ATP-binding protein
MSAPVAELIRLTKHFHSNWTFRRTCALDAVSFALREGEVLGLIGHNGAGKTTTLKLLIGLLRPTSGTILWQGKRLEWHHPRQGIGFSPEQPYFYDYLTVSETLNFYGQLYGMGATARQQRIRELVDQFHIAHKLHAPMRSLSKGTLQRVAVVQAIMHQPRLVILDEPMSGLDPVGRKEMRDLIASLKGNGTTVLFSSHILSDAEALCDRVAILASGRLQEVVDLDTQGAPPISYAMVVAGAPNHLLETLRRLAIEPPAGGPDRWTVRLTNQSAVQAALGAIRESDASVEALTPERPSLEQRFLRYASHGLSGE